MAATYALPLDPPTRHNSHNLGQGHGHTRSHHRKAAPERLPLAPTSKNGLYNLNRPSPQKGPLNGTAQQHTHTRSLPLNAWNDTCQTNQRNFQANHQHLPQDKSTGMERRSSRASTTIHAKHSSYGFPTGSVHGQEPALKHREASQARWMTTSEVVTSILIPLPYVLMPLIMTSQSFSPSPNQDPNLSNLSQPAHSATSSPTNVSLIPSDMVLVCALTSTTLLSVGILGKLRGQSDGVDRRKSLLGHGRGREKTTRSSSMLTAVQRVSGRILGVGLPFIAATKLGGERVAGILLVAAAADFFGINGGNMKITSFESWKSLLKSRKWTLAILFLQCISDLIGLTSNVGFKANVSGYLALGISAIIIPPPYPTSTPKSSLVTSPLPNSTEKTSTIATPFEISPPTSLDSQTLAKQSPMIFTPQDINLTLIAGAISALICGVVLITFSPRPALTLSSLSWMLLATLANAMSLVMADSKSLRSKRQFGLALGLVSPIIFQEIIQIHSLLSFACQGVLIGGFWLSSNLDTHSLLTSSHHPKHHGHHHHDTNSAHDHGNHSRFTGMLLRATTQLPLLHSILIEKDSRRIFYFMSLNFGFMLVQTFYAVVTGSLGLLSDSIHMLFDCFALVVGLCAAVMSKWPPSIRFPYGFGRMDTLAGFANGIFLMLISVEIVYEAIERLFEGSEMARIGELLTVSSLGLVVNLIGMTAFGHAHHGHGHGHSHGGHDHSHVSNSHDSHSHDHSQEGHSHAVSSHESHHSHSSKLQQVTMNGETSPLPFSVPPTPTFQPPPSHAHAHAHHHHGNENMHGIFLHILADTLGSVAVVISTVLIHYTNWPGFDPLASCLIAILIFVSAIPLVASSARTLLLTVPENTEFDLREALAGVGGLKGVVGVQAPRFWTGEREAGVQGVMHVVVAKGVDLEDVKERAVNFLRDRGMEVLVQVERDGEGRCWCGSGTVSRGG